MSNYTYFILAISVIQFLYTLSFFDLDFSAFSILLFISLSYASYYDLEHLEIPDLVSIGLFPVGAFWVLSVSPEILVHRLMEGIAALLFFFIFSRIFRGLWKKEGLGFGDIKLIASATVWIGLAHVPVMIFVASCSALIANFYNPARKGAKNPDTRIPFAPHLSAAIWFVWFLAALNVHGLEVERFW
ncbi:A24 family peptidase [Roseibium sp. MMSF_3412]|uniref:prepilin peptidase n=1 Tax=Roseibium sp. MMSF_3412 TaxID=3046712 RepID=UPI00273FBB2E|nr:A24 family peptidase [Roseibium sp. MMSF_3412]